MAGEYDDRVREAENVIEERWVENRGAPPSPPRDTIEPLTLSNQRCQPGPRPSLAARRSMGSSAIGNLKQSKIGNRTLIKTASIRKGWSKIETKNRRRVRDGSYVRVGAPELPHSLGMRRRQPDF